MQTEQARDRSHACEIAHSLPHVQRPLGLRSGYDKMDFVSLRDTSVGDVIEVSLIVSGETRMLVSIVIGEALYLAHRCRRALIASPVVLVGLWAVMTVMPHGSVHLPN